MTEKENLSYQPSIFVYPRVSGDVDGVEKSRKVTVY